MRIFVVSFILLSLLFNTGADAQSGDPRYEYRKLHKEKKGLKKHDYSPVTVDMSYPYFMGKDSDAKFLNAEVTKYLFEKHKTFDKFCAAFFQRHLNLAPESFANWLVDKKVSVLYSSAKIVSLGRSHTKQEGQNAFLETSQPVSYDLKTKKQLTLKNVFSGNYKPELTKLVWQKLKRDSKENGNEGIFYQEKVGKYLSEAYYFTGRGIVFSFDWGEIAPRISPGFEAEVPYSLIKKYINKNSPIWNLAQ